MRLRSTCALSLLLLAGAPAAARAQEARLTGTDTLEVRFEGGRTVIPLPCPASDAERVGSRLYVPTDGCGVLRVELSAASETGVRAARWVLGGRFIIRVRVVGDRVWADVSGPQGIERFDLEAAAATGDSGPPTRSGHADAGDEFVDLDAEASPRIVMHVYRGAAERSRPSVMFPERQSDRWELGASVVGTLTFPRGDAAYGAMTRARLVYRSELALMLRVDLMPFTLSIAEKAWRTDPVYGALGLFTAGLDLDVFGFGLGVGVASNNDRLRGPRGARFSDDAVLPVFASSLRVGAVDGLHLIGRAGVFVSSTTAGLALLEVSAQVPFIRAWALRARFAYSVSGNIEALGGARVWLSGHGEAESVGLTFEVGYVRAFDDYDMPSATTNRLVEHDGLGVGLGIEGRL